MRFASAIQSTHDRIADVVNLLANHQMGRINAELVVAGVPDNLPGGDSPASGALPRNPVGVMVSPAV